MGNTQNDDRELSHLDAAGRVRMVDISGKRGTLRTAKARGLIHLSPAALCALSEGDLPKGNVLTTAQLAGIQAAKKTSDLIPLCHPLRISWIDVTFDISDSGITIQSEVKANDSTGLEMEALTAVSVAALTIYDMCKSIDKTMTITDITLVEKTGGKSSFTSDYRPQSAVIVISDSISAGRGIDRSGKVLAAGLKDAGCEVQDILTVADEVDEIRSAVRQLSAAGTELILTSGGTGLGPRDVTLPALLDLLTDRLPGVEQALHAYGRGRLPTAMLSRLLAGRMDDTVIVSLPGSTKAAEEALAVLIPAIFHAFEMQHGAGHDDRHSG